MGNKTSKNVKLRGKGPVVDCDKTYKEIIKGYFKRVVRERESVLSEYKKWIKVSIFNSETLLRFMNNNNDGGEVRSFSPSKCGYEKCSNSVSLFVHSNTALGGSLNSYCFPNLLSGDAAHEVGLWRSYRKDNLLVLSIIEYNEFCKNVEFICSRSPTLLYGLLSLTSISDHIFGWVKNIRCGVFIEQKHRLVVDKVIARWFLLAKYINLMFILSNIHGSSSFNFYQKLGEIVENVNVYMGNSDMKNEEKRTGYGRDNLNPSFLPFFNPIFIYFSNMHFKKKSDISEIVDRCEKYMQNDVNNTHSTATIKKMLPKDISDLDCSVDDEQVTEEDVANRCLYGPYMYNSTNNEFMSFEELLQLILVVVYPHSPFIQYYFFQNYANSIRGNNNSSISSRRADGMDSISNGSAADSFFDVDRYSSKNQKKLVSSNSNILDRIDASFILDFIFFSFARPKRDCIENDTCRRFREHEECIKIIGDSLQGNGYFMYHDSKAGKLVLTQSDLKELFDFLVLVDFSKFYETSLSEDRRINDYLLSLVYEYISEISKIFDNTWRNLFYVSDEEKKLMDESSIDLFSYLNVTTTISLSDHKPLKVIDARSFKKWFLSQFRSSFANSVRSPHVGSVKERTTEISFSFIHAVQDFIYSKFFSFSHIQDSPCISKIFDYIELENAEGERVQDFSEVDLHSLSNNIKKRLFRLGDSEILKFSYVWIMYHILPVDFLGINNNANDGAETGRTETKRSFSSSSFAMPCMFNYPSWKLLFSLRKHGYSMNQLKRCCMGNSGKTLIVIEGTLDVLKYNFFKNTHFGKLDKGLDTKIVLGVLITVPWMHSSLYFWGSSDTIIFMIYPFFEVFASNRSKGKDRIVKKNQGVSSRAAVQTSKNYVYFNCEVGLGFGGFPTTSDANHLSRNISIDKSHIFGSSSSYLKPIHTFSLSKKQDPTDIKTRTAHLSNDFYLFRLFIDSYFNECCFYMTVDSYVSYFESAKSKMNDFFKKPYSKHRYPKDKMAYEDFISNKSRKNINFEEIDYLISTNPFRFSQLSQTIYLNYFSNKTSEMGSNQDSDPYSRILRSTYPLHVKIRHLEVWKLC